MKSSWSESLSWKKGRNKHNLNYHSRRVVACCSGIKQAGRQVAGPNYRQLEAASRSIWERWSCLWPRTSLCFSTRGTNRAAASHGGSRQSPGSPEGAGLLRQLLPTPGQRKPFPNLPAACPRLLGNGRGGSGTPGPGCPLPCVQRGTRTPPCLLLPCPGRGSSPGWWG